MPFKICICVEYITWKCLSKKCVYMTVVVDYIVLEASNVA